MTQEKMRKVITACVSAATVLLVLLLAFLVYQWIMIGTLNKRIAEAENTIAQYEEKIEAAEGDLEYYQSDLGKYLEALKLGFINQQGE